MSAAQGSIVVRAPIGNVYRQWQRIEDFPKFIPAVKKVQKLDVGHFSIVVSLNGKRHKAVFELMLQVPERRVAWRALAGRHSEHFVSGVLSLSSQPAQSTCVSLTICPGFHAAGT